MESLKCNICFDSFNDSSLRPRSLTCGHTFCETCLNNTIKNGTLICPTCRKVHIVNSVLELPVNFTLEELLSSLNLCSADINEGPSAGMCNEHPGKACIYRCTIHKSWVCKQCIDDQGDHPKHKCKITSIKEEIEDRRQEHKRSLDYEGKSCDETLAAIERHISYLNNERDRHIDLARAFFNLVTDHKEEADNLQNEITSFQKMIEKGQNTKKSLLDVEGAVMNAVTLDDSNATRDMVKDKNTEARNWVKSSQGEVDERKLNAERKLKLERSSHLAVVTKMSLACRGNCELQQELDKHINKAGLNEESANIEDIEITITNLNKITSSLYKYELSDSFRDDVLNVQHFLLSLWVKISNDVKGHGATMWAVKPSHTVFPVLTGQLSINNNRILLHSLQSLDNLPGMTIKFPYSQLIALSPPEIFLRLSHHETTIGTIHIRLNQQQYPKRVKQILVLTMGASGHGDYKYAGFDEGVWSKGELGENVICGGYINDKGYQRSSALYHLEMGPRGTPPPVTAGAVYGWPQPRQSGGFRICTKGSRDTTWPAPVIGHVISGLPILKAAAAKGNNYVRQIVFSDCGLIIG